MYVADAKTEMMTRIRSLDQEESFLRNKAEQHVTSANYCLDQADRLATTRRQYELAITDLGGEIEAPKGKARKIAVENSKSSHVVHVNAKTP
jgi:hypothetical protein